MKGKICLITGGNSGIGKATATGLAKLGATLVILCRNEEKGKEAVREIIARSGNANVDLIVADLASQKSVRAAAEQFRQKYGELHVLINNAAVFLPGRSETEDGIEITFTTNYLSHFLLSQLLLDLLKASQPSRIINVASKHSGISIKFDDLMLTRKYSVLKAVGPTKLALIMFTKELAKKLEGTGVTVNSLHPGIIKSNLLNKMPWLLRNLFHLFSSSPEKGAETSIYLASSPDVSQVSGAFYANSKPAPVSAAANDPEAAKRLGDVSEGYIRPASG